MLLDPFLSEAIRMGRCAILLEYEVVWQQIFIALDELRKQIIHVKICIHLHLLWHEVKPSLAFKAHSCRHHDVRRELGSLDQEASWINITFSASRPDTIVLTVHWQIYYKFINLYK